MNESNQHPQMGNVPLDTAAALNSAIAAATAFTTFASTVEAITAQLEGLVEEATGKVKAAEINAIAQVQGEAENITQSIQTVMAAISTIVSQSASADGPEVGQGDPKRTLYGPQ